MPRGSATSPPRDRAAPARRSWVERAAGRSPRSRLSGRARVTPLRRRSRSSGHAQPRPCTPTTVSGGSISGFVQVNSGAGHLSPPTVIVSTLPAATVTDLAALNVIPPFRIDFVGERILQSIESTVQTVHPNHWLFVVGDNIGSDVVGTIRILDQRTFTGNTVTLGANPGSPETDGTYGNRWLMPSLHRDTSDCYSQLIVRGGLQTAGTVLGVKQWPGSTFTSTWRIGRRIDSQRRLARGLRRLGRIYDECRGQGGLVTVDVHDPESPERPGPGLDQHVHGDDDHRPDHQPERRRLLGEPARPDRRGLHATVFCFSDVISGVTQGYFRGSISNTAMTAGGSCTLTLDRALPAVSYNSYRLSYSSSGGNVVWRRYKIMNAIVAVAMQQYFPYPLRCRSGRRVFRRGRARFRPRPRDRRRSPRPDRAQWCSGRPAATPRTTCLRSASRSTRSRARSRPRRPPRSCTAAGSSRPPLTSGLPADRHRRAVRPVPEQRLRGDTLHGRGYPAHEDDHRADLDRFQPVHKYGRLCLRAVHGGQQCRGRGHDRLPGPAGQVPGPGAGHLDHRQFVHDRVQSVALPVASVSILFNPGATGTSYSSTLHPEPADPVRAEVFQRPAPTGEQIGGHAWAANAFAGLRTYLQAALGGDFAGDVIGMGGSLGQQIGQAAGGMNQESRGLIGGMNQNLGIALDRPALQRVSQSLSRLCYGPAWSRTRRRLSPRLCRCRHIPRRDWEQNHERDRPLSRGSRGPVRA